MPTPVADARTELTFPVTGMTCASCVRRIEEALEQARRINTIVLDKTGTLTRGR